MPGAVPSNEGLSAGKAPASGPVKVRPQLSTNLRGGMEPRRAITRWQGRLTSPFRVSTSIVPSSSDLAEASVM